VSGWEVGRQNRDDVVVYCRVTEGNAPEVSGPLDVAILALADELDAGLIVLGSRGRSTVASALLGDVARDVLQGAAALVPLALVPGMARAQDIAEAALFLSSDEARFVNGHDLAVDGGILAGRPASAMRASWEVLSRELNAALAPPAAGARAQVVQP